MAKNLLEFLSKLDEWDCREITDAMRNHDPAKLVIDYNNLRVIGFLNRERVIAALLKVYRAYGTAAARATARKRGACSGDQ
jgi:hypothetical protein